MSPEDHMNPELAKNPEHRHPSITCDDVVSYICSQFGEDDSSERCRHVRAHLEKCPDCGAYCDSIDKLIAVYRAASPSFPPAAKTELLRVLGIE